jgi:hypothetical protein
MVELDDGRVVSGYFFGVTPEGPVEEQVLALEAPIFIAPDPEVAGNRYAVDRITIPLADVKYVSLVFGEEERRTEVEPRWKRLWSPRISMARNRRPPL